MGTAMRDYGTVYGSFWTSETTRGLSDQAKLLGLYLLTGPHSNMLGCFRLPDGYVEEDLRWGKETVSKRFGELFRNGFATRDDASKWVLLHAFLKWNPIDNPNQGKAAIRMFERIPACVPFKCELAKMLATQNGKVDRTVLEPFLNRSETVSKPGTGTGTGEGTETGTGSGSGSGTIAASPPAAEPKVIVRPRDLLWDAIVEITGADATLDGVASHIGKIKKSLLAAVPPYTPEDVLALPAVAARHMNWTQGRAIRLGEIVKNIHLVRNTGLPVGKANGVDVIREWLESKQ